MILIELAVAFLGLVAGLVIIIWALNRRCKPDYKPRAVNPDPWWKRGRKRRPWGRKDG